MVKFRLDVVVSPGGRPRLLQAPDDFAGDSLHHIIVRLFAFLLESSGSPFYLSEWVICNF